MFFFFSQKSTPRVEMHHGSLGKPLLAGAQASKVWRLFTSPGGFPYPQQLPKWSIFLTWLGSSKFPGIRFLSLLSLFVGWVVGFPFNSLKVSHLHQGLENGQPSFVGAVRAGVFGGPLHVISSFWRNSFACKVTHGVICNAERPAPSGLMYCTLP